MKHFRNLRDDCRGMTAVEFGLIVTPMCVLLLGSLDLAHQTYVRAVMQGALNDAARRAAVENPTFSSPGGSIEEQVENKIRAAAGPVAVNATMTITQQNYSNFTDIGDPEKLMTDVNGNGEFDADDGDCWEDANDNGEFDLDAGADGRGGASEVVFYTASVSMPRLFPLDALTNASSTIQMNLETAVRNQPYKDKAVPPVICADAS